MRASTPATRPGVGSTLVRWIDSWAVTPGDESSRRVDWVRVMPFLGLHLACLGVLWVGWSPVAVGVAIALYLVRMFAVTAFYHRYFSHRSFRTSRPFQLAMAVVGASAVQRGPLWWASHHRHHHRHADRESDVHSPEAQGFWWSHTGWFLCRANFRTRFDSVRDWMRFPELRFLDRFDLAVPLLLGTGLYALGAAAERWAPGLGTSGPQLLIWGFFVSTVVLYHATFTINSLAHRWGTRRFETPDQSRNNALLALLTLGEGWHNNHHHYPAAAHQGFRRWELDPSYWALRLLERLGVVWDLRVAPQSVRSGGPR